MGQRVQRRRAIEGKKPQSAAFFGLNMRIVRGHRGQTLARLDANWQETGPMSVYSQIRMRHLRRHDWTRRPEHRAAERSDGVARATTKSKAARI